MQRLLISMAFLGSAIAPAQAQSDLRFLKDAPISQFKKADTDLLAKALNQALEHSPDGVPVKWENPSANNSGSITPSKDLKNRSGCRKVHVENRHQALTSETSVVFCKIDGKWMVPGD